MMSIVLPASPSVAALALHDARLTFALIFKHVFHSIQRAGHVRSRPQQSGYGSRGEGSSFRLQGVNQIDDILEPLEGSAGDHLPPGLGKTHIQNCHKLFLLCFTGMYT